LQALALGASLKLGLQQPLPIPLSINFNVINGFDFGYDDGGCQNYYDFVGSSFRCRP
jgi:hypothetical protein